MQQTPTFHLSQWDPADLIRREDFNADNLKIENAITALSCGRHIKTIVQNPPADTSHRDARGASWDLSGIDWDAWEIVYFFNPYTDPANLKYDFWTLPSGSSHNSAGETYSLAEMLMRPFLFATFPRHNKENPFSGVFIGEKVIACAGSTLYKNLKEFYCHLGNGISEQLFSVQTCTWEIRGIR